MVPTTWPPPRTSCAQESHAGRTVLPSSGLALLLRPALDTTTFSLKHGELTKNCIPASMRCIALQRYKRHVGLPPPDGDEHTRKARARIHEIDGLTESTEPGRRTPVKTPVASWRRVLMMFCFLVDGSICSLDILLMSRGGTVRFASAILLVSLNASWHCGVTTVL